MAGEGYRRITLKNTFVPHEGEMGAILYMFSGRRLSSGQTAFP
jgi:hypothetical protein